MVKRRAKRKASRSARKAKVGRKSGTPQRSAKRPSRSAKASRKRAGGSRKSAKATGTRARKKTTRAAPRKRASSAEPRKAAARSRPTRLDRERRTLEESVPTPPSSLNMNRRGSAARTGRAELAEARHDHLGMTPAITGGDVDVNIEQAYFTGDEAPGGDNPTPDQDVVDDIGRAIGVEYQDNEELRASDKVADRDKHRWELDPASAEDYKERERK
jgi:hypothetical protein